MFKRFELIVERYYNNRYKLQIRIGNFSYLFNNRFTAYKRMKEGIK